MNGGTNCFSTCARVAQEQVCAGMSIAGAIKCDRYVAESVVSGQSRHALVSVIMPCYNAASFLPRSFASVLSQSCSALELIAVDDGSCDDTLSWLRAQTDRRVQVLTQPNRGVSSARNAGLAAATGQFIAFLDADDTWAPYFIERMLSAFNAAPSIGLAYCGWQNIGLSGERGEPFIPPDYEVPNKQELLIRSNRWPIHACMTTRELVTAAGGFDTRFAVGEDFLLWLEIGCFQRIHRIPEVLAFYFHHGGEQATRDRVRAATQTHDVQRAFLKRHPELIAKLGRRRVCELTKRTLLSRAYEAYWQRDLASARSIFRMTLRTGGWEPRDLRYLLPALLPSDSYQRLVRLMDAFHKTEPNK